MFCVYVFLLLSLLDDPSVQFRLKEASIEKNAQAGTKWAQMINDDCVPVPKHICIFLFIIITRGYFFSLKHRPQLQQPCNNLFFRIYFVCFHLEWAGLRKEKKCDVNLFCWKSFFFPFNLNFFKLYLKLFRFNFSQEQIKVKTTICPTI